MFEILILVTIQTLLFSAGQVLLKKAMMTLPSFSWHLDYFRDILANGWLLASGVSFGVATVLWLYVIRHFPLSQAYPLSALSYIIVMIAAIFVFGETVPISRWIGVLLIVVGCFFILK